jgi:hypothetical protein
MVDSDHSMSLSVVTRRRLLSGATSLALPAAMRPASVTGEGNDRAGQGDVVEAWRAWRRTGWSSLEIGCPLTHQAILFSCGGLLAGRLGP